MMRISTVTNNFRFDLDNAFAFHLDTFAQCPFPGVKDHFQAARNVTHVALVATVSLGLNSLPPLF
jgi:hypothetical protein